MQSALTAIEPISGNTLLHYLALSPRAKDMNTMFLSVISPFKTGGAKRRTALVEDYNIDQLSRFLNVQNTCLHHLASNPHAQCLLKDLLALGADLQLQDSRAQTPMYLMRDNIAASNVIRSHLVFAWQQRERPKLPTTRTKKTTISCRIKYQEDKSTHL